MIDWNFVRQRNRVDFFRSFRDQKNRQEKDDQEELEQLKQEVFNLPDNLARGLLKGFLLVS